MSFRYIPNPTKVLAKHIALGGEEVQRTKGKIVAGDPAELDVISLKGNYRNSHFKINLNLTVISKCQRS